MYKTILWRIIICFVLRFFLPSTGIFFHSVTITHSNWNHLLQFSLYLQIGQISYKIPDKISIFVLPRSNSHNGVVWISAHCVSIWWWFYVAFGSNCRGALGLHIEGKKKSLNGSQAFQELFLSPVVLVLLFVLMKMVMFSLLVKMVWTKKHPTNTWNASYFFCSLRYNPHCLYWPTTNHMVI